MPSKSRDYLKCLFVDVDRSQLKCTNNRYQHGEGYESKTFAFDCQRFDLGILAQQNKQLKALFYMITGCALLLPILKTSNVEKLYVNLKLNISFNCRSLIKVDFFLTIF